jgi:TfoX/Sxy family transcriptional regulator of competence genes
MASEPEFVQYIAEQMGDAGCITYRKMFGDYGMYCDGKIFALICDNQLFIKITDAGRSLCSELQEVAPYEGAKNYFLIEDVDNRDALVNLVTVTCTALPEPKPKKRRRLV